MTYPTTTSQRLAAPVCECRRCGWRWIAKTVELPKKCARCRSEKWQEAKGETR